MKAAALAKAKADISTAAGTIMTAELERVERDNKMKVHREITDTLSNSLID